MTYHEVRIYSLLMKRVMLEIPVKYEPGGELLLRKDGGFPMNEIKKPTEA